MRYGLMVASFFLIVVCASRLQNEQSMLDTWDNISNPKIAVSHSGFSSNFLGGTDCT